MNARRDTVFAIAREGICDSRLVAAVEGFLDARVPPEWWTAPASSSGQYHPTFALGDGGLVRHSVMVARWTADLANVYALSGSERSEAFAAGLCHDGFKGGEPWEFRTVDRHAHIAADAWREATGGGYPGVEDAIRRHFGVFDPVSPCTPGGMLPVAAVVALADYAASRKSAYDGTWPSLLCGL